MNFFLSSTGRYKLLASVKSTSDSTPQNNLNECIQAAANWHVEMHSGEVTPVEMAEFSLWYQRPENADAYDKFADIWNRFEPAATSPARAVVSQALHDRHSTLQTNSSNTFTRTAKAVASCFIIVGLSSYLLTNTLVGKVLFADHYVLSGELTTITLKDNSQIQLSPFSAVNIDYNHDNRRIELISGRVMIDVAKDINRPLTITSQHGSARALGTQFSVAYFGGSSDTDSYSQVSVYESKVEVCAVEKTAHQCQYLSAGQSSKVTAKAVEKPQAANKGWQVNLAQQILMVDDQPLINVLTELQAQHFGYLKINKAAIQHIRVSGVFPLNDVNHALTVLSATLPIKVSRYSSLLITIESDSHSNH